MAGELRIAEWPAEERPRERLYHKGAAALSDAEPWLDTARHGHPGDERPRRGARPLDGIRHTPGDGGARGGRGGGRARRRAGQAVRLAAAFEITRRLRSRNGHGRPLLSSPEQVFARYAPLMEDLKKEVFRLALLDAQNGLLRDVVVSEGTLSASLVHPREVFKPAILESAASIILLHNHPSGDPTPSREDLRLTRQLVERSKLLDLRIHDHVIIGRERFISLAQRGDL